MVNLNALFRYALSQAGHTFVHLFDNFSLIQGQKLAVTHNHLTVDDDGLHVAVYLPDL
jgi:hypothetical protein